MSPSLRPLIYPISLIFRRWTGHCPLRRADARPL